MDKKEVLEPLKRSATTVDNLQGIVQELLERRFEHHSAQGVDCPVCFSAREIALAIAALETEAPESAATASETPYFDPNNINEVTAMMARLSPEALAKLQSVPFSPRYEAATDGAPDLVEWLRSLDWAPSLIEAEEFARRLHPVPDGTSDVTRIVSREQIYSAVLKSARVPLKASIFQRIADAIHSLQLTPPATAGSDDSSTIEAFRLGAMESAPCFRCGYNGEEYFQPNKHDCAKYHHAMNGLDREEASIAFRKIQGAKP